MATKLSEIGAAEMRAAMIDSQLRTSDVIDPAVIAAMGVVAREAHVPAALSSVAYMDRAIDLGGGRMLNAPLVTGRLLVAADIRPGARVLLIGAGTGYTATLLARLGAEVHAVEEQADLLAAAQAATTGDTIHWIDGPLAKGGRLVAARREGKVTRLVQGVKTGGTIAIRAFADMDVAPLPGFDTPKGFQF